MKRRERKECGEVRMRLQREKDNTGGKKGRGLERKQRKLRESDEKDEGVGAHERLHRGGAGEMPSNLSKHTQERGREGRGGIDSIAAM